MLMNSFMNIHVHKYHVYIYIYLHYSSCVTYPNPAQKTQMQRMTFASAVLTKVPASATQDTPDFLKSTCTLFSCVGLWKFGIPPSCCKYRVKSSNVFTATSFTPITPGLRSSPSWRAPVRCKSRTALCTEHRRFFHRLIHNWNMVTTASSCLKTSKFYTKSQWILDTDCSGIHAGWCALEKKGVCQLIQSATGYRKLVAAI